MTNDLQKTPNPAEAALARPAVEAADVDGGASLEQRQMEMAIAVLNNRGYRLLADAARLEARLFSLRGDAAEVPSVIQTWHGVASSARRSAEHYAKMAELYGKESAL